MHPLADHMHRTTFSLSSKVSHSQVMDQVGLQITLTSRVHFFFFGLVFKQQCLCQVCDLQIHRLSEEPAADRVVSRAEKRMQDCPTEINLGECFAKPSKHSYICCCMQNTWREEEEGRNGQRES